MKTNAFKKTYQKSFVLSFPEFSFQPGRIYGLIGANGSGKSTFAKILARIQSADDSVSPFVGAVPTVGYLPQKPYAFRMSLKKNLLLNAYGSKDQDLMRANALLQELDLTALAGKKATTLSGGETARMALARLLMKDYRLLILDEPCAAMDIASTLRTEELLSKYCKEKKASIIIITHSLLQARRLADEVLFFQDGQLIEYGEKEQFFAQPVRSETKRFLEFFS